MLRFCVAGASGRMGNAIISEATATGHEIVGAIEAPNSPSIGRSLRELGITNSDTKIFSSDRVSEAVRDADVYISFTVPAAELVNIPIVANLGKRIILGTTGFNPEQNRQVIEVMSGKVPAVFSPNYSVGVNILFKLAEALKAFPQGYDFSLSEIHHTRCQPFCRTTAVSPCRASRTATSSTCRGRVVGTLLGAPSSLPPSNQWD